MAKNYTEILCGINQIEKEYYNTISQLNEKSFKEDKEKKAEIKKKIKRLKDIIQYYQEIVDKILIQNYSKMTSLHLKRKIKIKRKIQKNI